MISEDRFVGTILGVAIGDAFGLPYETMNLSRIAELFAPDKFIRPGDNKYIKGSELLSGSWSDDTQLTLATLDAIVESQGVFDMDAISLQHQRAYNLDHSKGWGNSTKNSCQRLVEGASWRDSGEPNGGGNGPMMKISPLGLRQAIVNEPLVKFLTDCVNFCRMTHLHPSAVVAGTVHAFAVSELAGMTPTTFNPKKFLSKLISVALLVESYLLIDPDDHIIANTLLAVSLAVENRISRVPASLSEKFNGATCFSPNSLGASYTAFLTDPFSFDSVRNVILAGGDTDSNAGIVGALLGALNGLAVFPKNLIDGVEDSDIIRTKAETLFLRICQEFTLTAR